MSVCIVGNSDNVIDSGLGEKVDSCDTVIRINDFLTAGHEKDVGKKTTVIACAFSGANKLVNDPSWPTKSLLLNSDVWMVRYPRSDRNQRALSCGLRIEDITYPDPHVYDELVASVYSRFWRKEPSSGLVAIAMAISKYPDQKIFIHGFDNKTGKEGKRHYFDPNFFDVDLPNDPVGHDWESESLYIEELIRNNKLKRLV